MLAVLLILGLAAGDVMADRAGQRYLMAAAKAKRQQPEFAVPMPRSFRFQQGVAPGTPEGVMSPAQTDTVNGVIYHSAPKMDPFYRAHELAHLVDAQVLSDGDRRYFQRLLQAPAGAWYQGSAADRPGASEIFADYYGAAALRMDPNREQPGSYVNIGPKRLAEFTRAMDRLRRRHGLDAFR